jgi:hypothetical protein
MANNFRVHDLISDNIYTQNILGDINFEKVPKVSGANLIFNSGGVNSILSLTLNQYNEITPNLDTLYIIIE